MSTANVAILIPVGGAHAKLVPDAVRSIMEGSRLPAEIIAVDDFADPPVSHSTLAALIVNAQRPDPVTLTVLERRRLTPPPAGPRLPAARNLALGAATAEWVLPLDADDLLMPGALDDFEILSVQFPRVTFWCSSYTWSPYDERSSRAQYGTGNFHRGGEVTPQSLRRGWPGITCSYFMRRERLLALGGYDEALQAAEDWELTLRYIATVDDVGMGPRPFIHRRTGRHAISDHLTRTKIYADGAEEVRRRIAAGLYPLEVSQ